MAFPAKEDFIQDCIFPSDTDFVDNEPAIPWREVECRIPFFIIQTRLVSTKNGEAMIMKMNKQDGSIVNAWTTKLIESQIKSYNCEGKKNKFIMSYGLKQSQKTKNSYYDFKIICK